jgi:glycosyltransferase involved in cell wall biosynthesis
MKPLRPIQILLTTCGAWYLRNTAKAFENRHALAAVWCTERNRTGISPLRFQCCWPFRLAMVPFFLSGNHDAIEKAFYTFFPIWRTWQNLRKWPACDAVQSIMGFATEPFDRAEQIGALKILDCPNSHPTSYYGYWQRECDVWCPGEKVPIPRWMFARMNRELARADVILCPSSFVRDTMVQNGVRAEKCIVNPFGVDTSVFKKRNQLPAKPRFICVATVCLRKGHQYLFRAFEIVKQQLPEAELICVGPDKVDFRRERPKWEGKFKHCSLMAHAELAALLQTCTAFVLASVEEGFARVISEAMAAGLPIIATYESGATTLVHDGVEGFVVRACDPEHLAQMMLRAASDNELNLRMGEASYASGAVKNTWQHYGDRLLAEYSARLDERRQKPVRPELSCSARA